MMTAAVGARSVQPEDKDFDGWEVVNDEAEAGGMCTAAVAGRGSFRSHMQGVEGVPLDAHAHVRVHSHSPVLARHRNDSVVMEPEQCAVCHRPKTKRSACGNGCHGQRGQVHWHRAKVSAGDDPEADCAAVGRGEWDEVAGIAQPGSPTPAPGRVSMGMGATGEHQWCWLRE